MIELKPCPFCGGKAGIMLGDPDNVGRRCEYVECLDCGATGPLYWRSTKTHTRPINGWNKRQGVE